MPHYWTDDEKRIIAERLRDGFTASQIATIFPNHSRNSVVGVVHRDKRLREIGFKTPGRGGINGKIVTSSRVPAAPPPFKPENRFNLAVKGGIRQSQKPTGDTPKPPPPPPPAPPIEAIGIPLVDIRDGQCRWPMWGVDPDEREFLMCGAATRIDKHYCQGHRAKAETAARLRYG